MRRLAPVLMLSAMFAACGSHSAAPTSPTTTALPATSGAMATITGTLQTPGSSIFVTSSSYGTALSGYTVTVVGTSITAVADGTGRFSLMNVPPGDVQLRISAPGTDATVPVTQVQAAQSVDLVIVVSGSTASVDSDVRSSGGQGELEGRVEALPPETAALTFKAAGRTIKTTASTQFTEGSLTRSFSDLQIGERVHVTGTVSGDTFTAATVLIQNTITSIPVELNGVIDSLTGTASAFQFKIGSHVIHGDATTTFFGDGDTPDTFGDLEEGSRVEVKGDQRNDFVFASAIHINGGTDTGGSDQSASIQGTLKTISGSTPALTLLVDTTTVKTTSGTVVRRRGDVQTLDTLKIGQTVHVVGDRQSDGSIVARTIDIDDDPAGNEVEIEGALGGLKGSCPSVSFGINGYQITTSGSTTFAGTTCSSLRSGDHVTVNGTKQSDGSIAAAQIKK